MIIQTFECVFCWPVEVSGRSHASDFPTACHTPPQSSPDIEVFPFLQANASGILKFKKSFHRSRSLFIFLKCHINKNNLKQAGLL